MTGMKRQYASVEAIENHAPDEHCAATMPYAVGILALPAFRDLIAYGQTFVKVEHYPAGGWLVRRGYVKVSGQWRDVQRFMRLWERMATDSEGLAGSDPAGTP